MIGEEENIEVDDFDEPSVEGSAEVEEAFPAESAVVNHEARRKLEAKLEQRRLEKEIQDFDYDLD